MTTLDLKLMPPPPLGARPALWIVGGTALVMLIAAARFVALGAWPILIFIVLDIALLIWAFRAVARAARAYERVRLDSSGLVYSRVAADGSAREFRLEPLFTRVELETLSPSPPENRLWLGERGRRLLVGRCLSPREREQVYSVLKQALAR